MADSNEVVRGGWRIRRKPGRKIWTVVFRAGGPQELSTGTEDKAKALEEGERLYADAVRRAQLRGKTVRHRALDVDLAGAMALWLVSLETTHAKSTRRTWEEWARHWIVYFDAFHNVTEGACRDLMGERLGKVRRQSWKREAAGLRNFVRWAFERKLLPELVLVPNAPRHAAGTACETRRRVAAVALTSEQVEAFLAALPTTSEASRPGHDPYVVRDRFIVQYETGLRPSSLDRLRAPDHYRPGESMLRLSDDTDKARWGRDVPLTPRAAEALERVLFWIELQRREREAKLGRPAPEQNYAGLVFGVHNYKKQVRAAARASLPSELAERFCAAHLRSARITHLIERGANLVGVQFCAGHRQLSTTSKYVKPSFRAAQEAMAIGAAMGEADGSNVIQFPTNKRSVING